MNTSAKLFSALLVSALALAGCGGKSTEEKSTAASAQPSSSRHTVSSTSGTGSESKQQDDREERYNIVRTLSAESPADVTGFSQDQIRSLFYSQPLSAEMAQRLDGDQLDLSAGYITADDLRLVRVLYCDFNGITKVGELVCNQLISEDLENIFFELYQNAYPVGRIVLPYGYGMDDEAVTTDNITRSLATVWDADGKASANEHSLGLAVDLNSLYNPQIITEGDSVIYLPAAGAAYADRTNGGEHYIDQNDLAYQIFTKYGFNWGGVWDGRNDYQHFEKYFNHDTGQIDLSVHS